MFEADFDDLVREIGEARRIPRAALKAITPYAERLEPQINALASRYLEDEWLYPAEQSLLFYGLFVLAAARREGFASVWFQIAALPEARIEKLFGDGVSSSVAAITLGLGAGDPARISALADKPALAGMARLGLIGALARLTAEEKFARADFVALVDRLAGEDPQGDNESFAFAIEEAIILGGLAEREDLLDQIHGGKIFQYHREIDRRGAKENMATAAAAPFDLKRFEEWRVAAPVNAEDGLGWLKSIERYLPVSGSKPVGWRERDWLAQLLSNGAADAMVFEEIDGLYHALAAGPDFVPPSEYLPVIWGEGPPFEDETEAERALDILMRHWNVVLCDVTKGGFIEPVLSPQEGFDPGQLWAQGFAAGVALRAPFWESLIIPDVDAGPALEEILDLADAPLALPERRDLLDRLPDNIARIARLRETKSAPSLPGAGKVGRNDPCPCGSGKKWKKCCGGTSQTLH